MISSGETGTLAELLCRLLDMHEEVMRRAQADNLGDGLVVSVEIVLGRLMKLGVWPPEGVEP